MNESNIKFGLKLPFAPLEKIFECASFAEAIGLDSVWYPDHLLSLNPFDWSSYSAWCILSNVAKETKNCTIGTSVTDCSRLNVAVLAQMVMTIQKISGGRFVLGIGLGEAQNLIPYGMAYSKKIDRLREYITSLRKLLTSDEVDYRGNFVYLSRAAIRPLLDTAPPIWIGANSKRTIELTAELADGWMPIALKFLPSEYYSALIQIRSIRGENAGFTPALFLHTLADKKWENAWRRVKDTAKLLLIMWIPEIYEKIGITIDRELHADRLVFNSMTIKRLMELISKIPDDPAYSRLAVGTPDDCVDYIDKYIKSGVTHFILSFLSSPADLINDVKFYKENVLSYFM